jgi:GT2 family glycosyltransferase
MSLAFFLAVLRRRRRAEAVIDRRYAAWARRDVPKAAVWRARVEKLRGTPSFSIVMPVHETDPRWLAEAVASVRAQFYDKWELLITDDGSRSEAVAACLAALPVDHRIDVLRLSEPIGISAASNAALARAAGDYVTFLDHDDRLAPHALAAAACEIAENPSLDLLFSDEDQLVRGRRARPYFKPGWNPDLLLSQNLVCHMAVYRRTLVTSLGGLRKLYDGSQDYDLALRVAGEVDTKRIRHIPEVLYHWRQSAGSYSAVASARCADAARRALADHLGARAVIGVDPALPQWPAVKFALPRERSLVSVIGGAAGDARVAVYGAVEQVSTPGEASGAVLLFLAGGLAPVAGDWLEALVAQAMRPAIGAAGARLTGTRGALLHAGFNLDPVRVAVSPPARADADDPGYRGHFRLARSVAAVSGDCLAVRRSVFVAAGGLNADAGDFWDVDLCLRLAARGLRCVWEPAAWLRYAGKPAVKRAGLEWMRARWARALAADPYVNPHLSEFGVT